MNDIKVAKKYDYEETDEDVAADGSSHPLSIFLGMLLLLYVLFVAL